MDLYKSYLEQDAPQSYTAFADGSLVRRFVQEMPEYKTCRFFEHPTYIRIITDDGIVTKWTLGPKGWQYVSIYMNARFFIH
jgi:hypothetical protein